MGASWARRCGEEGRMEVGEGVKEGGSSREERRRTYGLVGTTPLMEKCTEQVGGAGPGLTGLGLELQERQLGWRSRGRERLRGAWICWRADFFSTPYIY